MADGKPFEPTQSRLARARREGDVAISQELVTLCAFAAAAAATATIAAPVAAVMLALLHGGFTPALPAFAQLAALTAVPIGAAACAAICGGVFQTGGLRIRSIAPKFERLSPGENLKRIISRETATGVLRAAAGFAVAGMAVAIAAREVGGAALNSGTPLAIAGAAWRGSLGAAAAACTIAGLFGVADYGLQVRRRQLRLRMSHDELRRDRKEQDGDPVVRGRRRTLHRQFARGAVHRVKKAAFVVCNPEHLAIALEYKPPAVPVPRVLVCAADELANRVREVAAACGIPLVRNVALARLLYETGEPDTYIPPEAYVAVAEIVTTLQLGSSE